MDDKKNNKGTFGGPLESLHPWTDKQRPSRNEKVVTSDNGGGGAACLTTDNIGGDDKEDGTTGCTYLSQL